MMGAIEQGMSKLSMLRAGGALTEALSPIGCDVENILRSCFTAEMLLDVEGGKKRADAIAEGDKLWSRDERDPDGPLALKRVEERFVRVSPVLHMRVAGQVLRTTGEHPFWVENRRSWVPARELAIGDLLLTRCGGRVAVEGVADSGKVETVYNWRIADYHTYFVGGSDWDFSVWAHNSYGGSQPPSFPGTKMVDTRKLLSPLGGRQSYDPVKLAAHGPFDWSKYTPILVEETTGGLRYVVNGLTRIENAQRAGIMDLPAIVTRI